MPYERKPKAEDLDDAVLAFDMAGVGLCISRRGLVFRGNREFGQIFGYALDELNGLSVQNLYPSRAEFDIDCVQRMGDRQQEIRWRCERIMRRKDGSLFWCRVISRSLATDASHCTIWSVEDISAVRPIIPALSGREREVAQLVIAGKTSRDMARALAISPRTIEVYRARLMRKYRATNVVDLIRRIVELPHPL